MPQMWDDLERRKFISRLSGSTQSIEGDALTGDGAKDAMITEIGIVSGEIWHYLEQHKTCTLTELAQGTDKNRSVVLMALGWLAREGHVILDDRENDYKITLRF